MFDFVRYHCVICNLVRAAADLDDLRPSLTSRGLRHLRTSAKRRNEVAAIAARCVTLIEESVAELRDIDHE